MTLINTFTHSNPKSPLLLIEEFHTFAIASLYLYISSSKDIDSTETEGKDNMMEKGNNK